MTLAIHHALRTSERATRTSERATRTSERATQFIGRFQIAPRLEQCYSGFLSSSMLGGLSGSLPASLSAR